MRDDILTGRDAAKYLGFRQRIVRHERRQKENSTLMVEFSRHCDREVCDV